MKKLISLALALLVAALLISSCAKDDDNGTADTTAASDTTAATPNEETTAATTEAETTAAPETTAAETEPETEPNPPEDLIDYESIVNSKTDVTNLIDLDSLEWDVDGFNEQEEAPSLFDGDTETKYCCSLPPIITFKTTEPVKLTAYAHATANDNSQYGRAPEEWIFYGSTDGENWVVLDYVQEASQVIERVDFTYYAFLIDEDKQGEYQYYKFEVFEAEGGTTFQMSEFQIFTD